MFGRRKEITPIQRELLKAIGEADFNDLGPLEKVAAKIVVRRADPADLESDLLQYANDVLSQQATATGTEYKPLGTIGDLIQWMIENPEKVAAFVAMLIKLFSGV